MEQKKSCLSFNPDVTTAAEILESVAQVGEHVCMVKTHMDVVEDFSQDLVDKLQKMSEELNFVIFEDRKFADIGNTVCHAATRIFSFFLPPSVLLLSRAPPTNTH